MPREQHPFAQIVRPEDKWAGTAVFNLRDMFTPTNLGLDDVLHSQVVCERDASSHVVMHAPLVKSLNHTCIRRELPLHKKEKKKRIGPGVPWSPKGINE